MRATIQIEKLYHHTKNAKALLRNFRSEQAYEKLINIPNKTAVFWEVTPCVFTQAR